MRCIKCTHFLQVPVSTMDKSVPEDELTPEIYQCQICWENMLDRKPRSLTCGHSFCQRCLQKLVKRGRIDCPTCRSQTLTPEGVDKLPLDFKLSKFKDMEKDLVLNVDFLCQMCFMKGKKAQALVRCIQCYRTMCGSCKEMHSKIPAFKGHKLDQIKPPEVSNKICIIHGQTISYLCHECMKGICIDCMFSADHMEHNDKIEDFQSGCRQARIRAEELHNDLQHEEAKLEKRENQIRLDVEKMVQISDGLKKQKSELEQKTEEANITLNDIHKNYHIPADEYRKQVHKTRERLKPTLDALQDLKLKDDHDFVSKYLQIMPQAEIGMEETSAALQRNYKIPTLYKALYETSDDEDIEELTVNDLLTKKPKKILRLLIQDTTDSNDRSDDSDCDSGEKDLCKRKIHIPDAEIVSVIPLKSSSLLLFGVGSEKIVRIDNKGNIISYHFPPSGHLIFGACVQDEYLYIVSAFGKEEDKGNIQITRTPFSSKVKLPDNPVVYTGDPDNPKMIMFPTFVQNDDEHIYFIELEVDDEDEDGDGKCKLMKHNIKRNNTTELSHIVTKSGAAVISTSAHFETSFLAVTCDNNIKIIGTDGKEIRTLGGEDAGEGKLGSPGGGVVVTKSGYFLVADSGKKRICLFEQSGRFVKDILTDEDVPNPHFMALQGRRLWVSECDSDDENEVSCFLYE